MFLIHEYWIHFVGNPVISIEYKLRTLLPKQFSDILTSYIWERIFRVKFIDDYSEIKHIKAGVPQGSVLGPTLYLLYVTDIPTTEDTMTATLTDDTAILSIGIDFKEAAEKHNLL